MKALLSVDPGGPETLVLTELPAIEPGPGELRVKVLACGINYPDVLVIEDKHQIRPPRPFAPGQEISATVISAGGDVSGWSPGDRLLAFVGHGGLAEEMVIRADQAFALPTGQDAIVGAGLILTYATTLHALSDRGRLKAGETLLVLGAAGGVGLAAIEIGKAMGAHVVAAVSSPEKASAAMDAGADETVIYGRGPFSRDEQKALSGAFKAAVGPGGADIVYDPVGGDYAEPALRSIAWEGRYLVIGFAAGIPKMPLNLPLLKSCDICGVFWGAFVARSPDAHKHHIHQLFDWWQKGKITPRIDKIYSLDEGGKALAHLANRTTIGKVVVRVSN